jgi:hypothetical protein
MTYSVKPDADALKAPCRFCGYNGQGYYGMETHKKDCPWYHIGGKNRRKRAVARALDEVEGAIDVFVAIAIKEGGC